MDTSLDAEVAPEEPLPEEQCPLCRGAGFVHPLLASGRPDFSRIVACRCAQAALKRGLSARLERYSNLGPLTRLTFDNLIPRGRSGEASNQERFAAIYQAAKAFAQNPEGWLVLCGPSGCGKTHLAAAIANHRLGGGHPALFVVVPDLLDHLRSTFSPSSEVPYDEFFEQVREAPLLVLDDLGAQASTPWAQEKLFQIINHRFNCQLPTIVTTGTSLEELGERLCTRLTDPSLCRVYVVEESRPSILEHIGSLGLELLSNMTFEHFDSKGLHLTPGQRETLQMAYRLARQFAESPEGWLVFLGPNGCGKTHLAAAIANHRLRGGQPVFFVVVPDLLDDLRSALAFDSRSIYERLERLKTAPLLLLDDFGTQASTPWAQEKLYQIINYRYNARLPTVITSVFSLDEIEARFSSRMGDCRLSTVIGIEAPDYRIDRKLSERAEPRRRPRKGRY
ncbi:MAG: ATP-binding protein [Dehalococcoidia bacterium]